MFKKPLSMYHFVILPPAEIDLVTSQDIKCNEYLSNYHHHLHYSAGHHTMINVSTVLYTGSIIYTQGLDKVNMLSELLPLMHIKPIDAPSLKTMPMSYQHISCPLKALTAPVCRYNCNSAKCTT